MSECELACPPQWSCDHASKQPSLFLLAILECGCLFSFRIFIYFWTSCGFQFCCKTSVLTMSSQDKKLRGKAQRKSAFVDIFSRLMTTICNMAAGMFVVGWRPSSAQNACFSSKISSYFRLGRVSFICLWFFHWIEDLLHF